MHCSSCHARPKRFMPSYGLPALIYDHKCAGSDAYIKLAGEVIRRERGLRAA